MSSSIISALALGLQLLTVGNPKIEKGTKRGYATAGLHLAPAYESGNNTCAAHTSDCASNCLFFAGRGAMGKVKAARIRRTNLYFNERDTFLRTLQMDIKRFAKNAAAQNLTPAYRLNLTSDIRWELHNIPQADPSNIYYDYSKLPNRKNLPPNYKLTFSFSGDNLAACRLALANGINVAVPFLKRPTTWLGHPVIDGDDDDLRFLDPSPCIVGLRAKGPLRKSPQSPFLGDNHG